MRSLPRAFKNYICLVKDTLMTLKTVKHLLFAALCLGLAAPAMAGIGKGHHVNIVSFQADDEATSAPEYKETVNGSFSNLIDGMEGKAEPLLMVHTPHIHSGDIINVQVDVLGQGEAGLEDDGLNCSLSYNEVGEGKFEISGMCTILMATAGGGEKQKVFITPKAVPSSAADQPAWVLIFFDKKTGVAFYANIEE